MKHLVSLLLLLLLPGCSRNLVEATSASAVTLATDKRVYTRAERLTLYIDNNGAAPIFVHDCISVEQPRSGLWSPTDELGWKGCLSRYLRVEPGQRLEQEGFLYSSLTEGQYRLTASVSLSEGETEPEQVSTDEFSITE